MKAFAAVCLALLAGCATTPPVPITQAGINSVSGREVTLVTGEKPDFAAMTPGGVGIFGGVLGALAMIAEGNRIVRDNGIDDPAPGIAQALADDLMKRHGLKPTQGVLRVATDDIAQVAKQRPAAGLVLEVRTLGWGFMYYPTSWNRYRASYQARARLVDLRHGTTVAESRCVFKGEESPASPTHDQLLADQARGLKRELVAAAEYCLNEFRTQTFLLAAKAPSLPAQPPVAGAAEAPAVRTPLPDNVRVVAPGPDVAARHAAFSGTWVGRWGTQDHTLVVEKIEGQAAALVYSWGIGARTPNPGYRRVAGRFAAEGALELTMFNGDQLKYVLSEDGRTLKAEHQREGRLTRTTLERRLDPSRNP